MPFDINSTPSQERDRDIAVVTRLLRRRSDHYVARLRYRLEQQNQQHHPSPSPAREKLKSMLDGLDEHFIECYADELEKLHGDRGWLARQSKKEPLRLAKY